MKLFYFFSLLLQLAISGEVIECPSDSGAYIVDLTSPITKKKIKFCQAKIQGMTVKHGPEIIIWPDGKIEKNYYKNGSRIKAPKIASELKSKRLMKRPFKEYIKGTTHFVCHVPGQKKVFCYRNLVSDRVFPSLIKKEKTLVRFPFDIDADNLIFNHEGSPTLVCAISLAEQRIQCIATEKGYKAFNESYSFLIKSGNFQKIEKAVKFDLNLSWLPERFTYVDAWIPTFTATNNLHFCGIFESGVFKCALIAANNRKIKFQNLSDDINQFVGMNNATACVRGANNHTKCWFFNNNKISKSLDVKTSAGVSFNQRFLIDYGGKKLNYFLTWHKKGYPLCNALKRKEFDEIYSQFEGSKKAVATCANVCSLDSNGELWCSIKQENNKYLKKKFQTRNNKKINQVFLKNGSGIVALDESGNFYDFDYSHTHANRINIYWVSP